MKRFTVYQLTNTANGKRYVGITSQRPEKRFSKHKSEAKRGCQYALHKAIRKYGPDAFVLEVLDVLTTEAGVKRAEQLWIAERETHIDTGKGYNLSLGGEGRWGCKTSEETKRKQSEAAKRRTTQYHPTPEVTRRRLETRKGFKHSAETRLKMSETAKGRPPSEACVATRRNWNPSEETRAKMRDSHLAKARARASREARNG